MNAIARLALLSWVVWCVAGPVHASDASLAMQWNAAVLEVAEAEDRFLTLKGLRTVTLIHLAMHDALNGRNGRYHRYLQALGEQRESRVDAAIYAAFAVASRYYPDHRKRFEDLQTEQLASLHQSTRHENSAAWGAEIAAAVIASRDGDGWDGDVEYQWHPMAPGIYAEFNEHSGTPDGFVFGTGWADARGFGFDAPTDFRVPPPPAIDSDAYTTAFDEVKSLGRFQSIRRTVDQTHIALWWKDFVENSHNRLARDLIEREGLDLVDATRLLAVLNMSIYDAYVASFENKFHYNHWRPYTAIRWADHDGNADTTSEATWDNTHRHTYAFPSYPSAHGTACAAAMTALESVFGTDFAFTMRTPRVDIAGPLSEKIVMQPTTRTFARFSDAAEQCSLSRVYLGIHFRYDAVEGVALGRRVGKHLLGRLLNPVDD
ncbi:MAG: vanadium-dependent haloperoxidase [Pseudomonadota bacterium]